MQRTAIRGSLAVVIIVTATLVGYTAGTLVGDPRVINHKTLAEYINSNGKSCNDIIRYEDQTFVCEITMTSPTENIKVIKGEY
jgi:hypothetical protein